MKKLSLAGMVLVVAVFAFMSTNAVYAKGGNPPFNRNQGVFGRGMHAGKSEALTGNTVLTDSVITAWAEKLGLTVEEIEARLAEGDTIRALAAEAGIDMPEFKTLTSEYRDGAIEQAVADGTLTQEQADYLLALHGNGTGLGLGLWKNCLKIAD